MKKILVLLLTVIVALSSCMKEDLDQIRKDQTVLASRVLALEKWQALINENISSLQSIINAQGNNDYVTGVTTLTDGSGYVINFAKSGAITIKHGEKGATGATPKIGVKEEDGVFYWTLNDDYLLSDGNKLCVTGTSAPIPQLKTGNALNLESGDSSYEADATYLSVDNGATWTKVTGPQGDAIFAIDGINTDSEDYVELTLANGTTTIRLPRYKTFQIGTDTENTNKAITLTNLTTDVPLSMPSDFTTSDYTAIMAQITSDRGTSTDIQTRATALPWKVSVTKPTFDPITGVCDAQVTVIAPDDITDGETAMLEVSIVGTDGNKTIATRALKYTATAKVGDFYYSDGTFSTTLITSKTCIGIIFHTGDVAKDDAILRAKIGDTSTGNHGLVVALKDASKTCAWQMADVNIGDAGLSSPYISIYVGKNDEDDPDGNLNLMLGYNNTEVIKDYNNKNNGNEVLAVKAVETYAASNTAPINSSGWYLPSIKELSLVCSGVVEGSIWDIGWPDANFSNKDIIESKFNILNVTANIADNFATTNSGPCKYWSSTEAKEDNYFNPANVKNGKCAWVVQFYDSIVYQGFKSFGENLYVRAILAF